MCKACLTRPEFGSGRFHQEMLHQDGQSVVFVADIREACRNAMKKGLPKWLAPVRKNQGIPPRPSALNGIYRAPAWALALEKVLPIGQMTLAQRKAELGRQAKRLREGKETSYPWKWDWQGGAASLIGHEGG